MYKEIIITNKIKERVCGVVYFYIFYIIENYYEIEHQYISAALDEEEEKK
jgi:hypothetical protein